MNATEFKEHVKRIRKYAKKFNVKIILSSRLKVDEYCPVKKNIYVVANNKYEEVISAILHELGHAQDHFFFPDKFCNKHNQSAIGKNEETTRIQEYLEKRRLALAETQTGRLKTAILKKAHGKELTPNQKKLISQFRKTLNREDYKVMGNAFYNFYNKNKMTPEEKQELVDMENRAWKNGKAIMKLLNIDLKGVYYNEWAKWIKTYENVK